MSFPFVLAVCGATLGSFFALLSLALAKAPGWKELRWFALIAGSAGAYCACVATELESTDDTVVLAVSRAAFALAALNTFAWLRYSTVQPDRTLDRALEALAVAVGALALVPGLLLGSAVVRHEGASAAGVVRWKALAQPHHAHAARTATPVTMRLPRTVPVYPTGGPSGACRAPG